mmetsp:Transcript_40973/g.47105  ORF Transcript_40973/g.47105 Transcript_40973/m.47105 type:complete len:239 (+) Transcript_40973:481-1197(+)
MRLSRDDLPEPTSPMIQRNSPFSTSSSMFLRVIMLLNLMSFFSFELFVMTVESSLSTRERLSSKLLSVSSSESSLLIALILLIVDFDSSVFCLIFSFSLVAFWNFLSFLSCLELSSSSILSPPHEKLLLSILIAMPELTSLSFLIMRWLISSDWRKFWILLMDTLNSIIIPMKNGSHLVGSLSRPSTCNAAKASETFMLLPDLIATPNTVRVRQGGKRKINKMFTHDTKNLNLHIQIS